ncbi:hypothetical protein E8E11_008589 [Didymella keratinophila]|nr:hypothetical protein E8E11_008589 [Didymella keratinophila]
MKRLLFLFWQMFAAALTVRVGAAPQYPTRLVLEAEPGAGGTGATIAVALVAVGAVSLYE